MEALGWDSEKGRATSAVLKRVTAPAPRAKGDGVRFEDPFFAAFGVAFGVDAPFLAMEIFLCSVRVL